MDQNLKKIHARKNSGGGGAGRVTGPLYCVCIELETQWVWPKCSISFYFKRNRKEKKYLLHYCCHNDGSELAGGWELADDIKCVYN